MSYEISEEDYLAHYGILRKSGRYPWGSGETQAQRNKDFLAAVDDLRKKGVSDPDIVKAFGLPSTTALRSARSIAKNEQKAANIAQAQRLKDHGWSNVEIGKKMGINESSVRSLLAPGQADKVKVLDATAEMLQRRLEEKPYLDVGTGAEYYANVSRSKLDNAIAVLREKGYAYEKVQVDQLGTGNKTTIKVLAKPGTTYPEIKQNMDKLGSLTEYSDDGGRTFLGVKPPMSIDLKRVAVRYAEQGGTDADGVIYVRPGKDDISLGGNRYAQVRIAVNGTHYLKGMAVYKDDLPDGVDLMFNTNKEKAKIGDDKLAAMKPMKKDKDGNIDPDNPFGSAISRQIVDAKTDKLTSVMNIVNEEGDWDRWSRNFSTQLLSKQSPSLAKERLDETFKNKKADLDEIMQLTNPAVKRKLLEAYADGADSSAVHLKAAALPRSQSHVILPLKNIKEGEIYAPNYDNGDRVALVRYPHGGIFEIPELTVNNRNREGQSTIGRQATDAVGIHPKVAQKLSGADFDGDTVLVIRNNKGQIQSAPSLRGLKNFDPQHEYPAYEGMPKMSAKTKGLQMGLVSNLITDMTIKGASNDELARAVRHSMVVIDAEKHNLNYKQSAKDNGIPALMEKYQGKKGGGASTLISQATARKDVPKRKNIPTVDRETGKLIWRETGESRVDPKTGKVIVRMQESQKLKETDDAFTLSSGTKIESVYAEHSNRLKSLANQARKEAVSIKAITKSSSAAQAYAPQVESLNAKLALAMRNRPRERQAQVLANVVVQQRKRDNPDMDKAEEKKLNGQVLQEMRRRTGAEKKPIVIEPDEWEAIQMGAITNTKLNDILDNADLDQVRQLAMPRATRGMTAPMAARARAMEAQGHTQAEIAEALGVSTATIKDAL